MFIMRGMTLKLILLSLPIHSQVVPALSQVHQMSSVVVEKLSPVIAHVPISRLSGPDTHDPINDYPEYESGVQKTPLTSNACPQDDINTDR